MTENTSTRENRKRIRLWTPDGYPYRAQAENALADIERMHERDGRWPSVYVFVTGWPSLADLALDGAVFTDTLHHREAVCPKCKDRWLVFAPTEYIGEASPGVCSTCPTKRTIVGSGPARKPLPYETDAERREAVERALKCCEAALPTPSLLGASRTPAGASWKAWATRPMLQRDAQPAGWLPAELRYMDTGQLRELLRGMPPRAEP